MFDPLALLQIAEELGDRTDPKEGHFRSAINRAYFAMHLKSAWGLEKDGLYSSKREAQDHGRVIEVLRTGAKRRGAGDRLATLRRLRERADYILDDEITSETWAEARELAIGVQSQLQPNWDKPGA